MPWPAGFWALQPVQTTLVGPNVPVMVPEVADGQAGWLSPPHRKIITAPATCFGATRKCARIRFAFRFAKVSVKFKVPSAFCVGLKSPVGGAVVGWTFLWPRIGGWR